MPSEVAPPAGSSRSSRAGRLVRGWLLGATVVPVVGCGAPQVEPGDGLRGDSSGAPAPGVAASTNTPAAPASASAAVSAEPPRRVIPIYGSTEIRILNKVFFPAGSSQIPQSSDAMLEEVAKVLKDNPELRVEVEGHSDGTEPDGEALSGRRADAVIVRLTKAGVDATHLTRRAFSATQPAAPNDSSESRAKNRRVSFRVIEGP